MKIMIISSAPEYHETRETLWEAGKSGTMIRSRNPQDDGGGERGGIGRNRQAGPHSRTGVERVDPEGGKTPEGEWRRREGWHRPVEIRKRVRGVETA